MWTPGAPPGRTGRRVPRRSRAGRRRVRTDSPGRPGRFRPERVRSREARRSWSSGGTGSAAALPPPGAEDLSALRLSRTRRSLHYLRSRGTVHVKKSHGVVRVFHDRCLFRPGSTSRSAHRSPSEPERERVATPSARECLRGGSRDDSEPSGPHRRHGVRLPDAPGGREPRARAVSEVRDEPRAARLVHAGCGWPPP